VNPQQHIYPRCVSEFCSSFTTRWKCLINMVTIVVFAANMIIGMFLVMFCYLQSSKAYYSGLQESWRITSWCCYYKLCVMVSDEVIYKQRVVFFVRNSYRAPLRGSWRAIPAWSHPECCCISPWYPPQFSRLRWEFPVCKFKLGLYHTLDWEIEGKWSSWTGLMSCKGIPHNSRGLKRCRKGMSKCWSILNLDNIKF
jgi:hypothetical protein